jgi:hypothetical protein
MRPIAMPRILITTQSFCERNVKEDDSSNNVLVVERQLDHLGYI